MIAFKKRDTLDELIALRADFLVGYQNAAYAEVFQSYVQGVRVREQALLGGTAMTRSRFLLMALAAMIAARLSRTSARRTGRQTPHKG